MTASVTPANTVKRVGQAEGTSEGTLEGSSEGTFKRENMSNRLHAAYLC